MNRLLFALVGIVALQANIQAHDRRPFAWGTQNNQQQQQQFGNNNWAAAATATTNNGWCKPSQQPRENATQHHRPRVEYLDDDDAYDNAEQKDKQRRIDDCRGNNDETVQGHKHRNYDDDNAHATSQAGSGFSRASQEECHRRRTEMIANQASIAAFLRSIDASTTVIHIQHALGRLGRQISLVDAQKILDARFLGRNRYSSSDTDTSNGVLLLTYHGHGEQVARD